MATLYKKDVADILRMCKLLFKIIIITTSIKAVILTICEIFKDTSFLRILNSIIHKEHIIMGFQFKNLRAVVPNQYMCTEFSSYFHYSLCQHHFFNFSFYEIVSLFTLISINNSFLYRVDQQILMFLVKIVLFINYYYRYISTKCLLFVI